jgi:hypothetical protein
MFIRAMEYLERFGIDTRKIEPTPIFMRPPWNEMDEDRIDLILTGIPKGSGSERFRKEAAKIIQEKYERHQKIYTDGSKKDVPTEGEYTNKAPSSAQNKRQSLKQSG